MLPKFSENQSKKLCFELDVMRPPFLSTVVSVVVSVVAGSKPNILFLQCDEMDGRVLDPSHLLSKITSMPHLEALAQRGVNFVRAYTVNPLCAPSRASTFTGRFASSIRAFSNVKSLTTTIGKPGVADPECARIIGYGADWCIEQGRHIIIQEHF